MISKDKEKQKEINKNKRKLDKILSTFLADITILVDQQEKQNSHIINYFDNLNIKYEVMHLETGDYSFIYDKVDFSDLFSLERKNSMQELVASMFASRFEKEIARGNKMLYFEIFVEKSSLNDLLVGNYKIDPNSDKHKDVEKKIKDSKDCIRKMFYSRKAEYNLQFNFLGSPGLSGQYILGNIKYFLRNFLLHS